MIKPNEMIEIILEKVMQRLSKKLPTVRYAIVDPDYVSGKPKLTFYGETNLTLKGYTYLASYTPTPGDKVMVLNNTIIGKIAG